MGCLKRAYIFVKWHVEEIALEHPLEQKPRKKSTGFLAELRKLLKK